MGTPVRVRASARGDSVVLEVEDEGGGIAPEQQEQLFERFYRLDGTRASGSGLGLAIAKRASRADGGRARAEIEGAAGRRFTLSCPPAPRSRITASHGSSETVLP